MSTIEFSPVQEFDGTYKFVGKVEGIEEIEEVEKIREVEEVTEIEEEEENDFDFESQNKMENNFIVNSGAYQELQTNATFCNWNYVNNEFDVLHNNNNVEFNVSSNVLCDITQNKYEYNNVEDAESNQYGELQE
ncbi:9849_t:CDS:2, partial [Gigaspora margarita]